MSIGCFSQHKDNLLMLKIRLNLRHGTGRSLTGASAAVFPLLSSVMVLEDILYSTKGER